MLEPVLASFLVTVILTPLCLPGEEETIHVGRDRRSSLREEKVEVKEVEEKDGEVGGGEGRGGGRRRMKRRCGEKEEVESGR